MLEKNKIYNVDCIKGFKQIENNSIDCIIADPPYNLSKSKNWSYNASLKGTGFGGKWNITDENWDNLPFKDYIDFTLTWLSEAKRVLKNTGSIWVFGTYHNIGIINISFQLLEIEIINEIIWYKRNAFPNLSNRRFTASHENILWGHKGGPKNREYFFNAEILKTTQFPEDNLKNPGKQMRTVWDIPNNKKKGETKHGKHPTQKPIRVLNRMLLASTQTNDTVLSPFSGAGSECAAALAHNRNFIGFEINKKYVEIADKRLENITKRKNTVNE